MFSKLKASMVVLLSFLVLLTVVPISSAAEPETGNEIVEFRELSSKTYELSDGTYKTICYASNVHYEDKNGQLQEIKTELIPVEKDSVYIEKYKYTNKANAFNLLFGDNKDGIYPISLKYNDATISMGFYNGLESQATQLNLLPHDSVLQDCLSADNYVSYADVFADVDIMYVSTENGFKENIIFKSPSAKNEIIFTLNTENVEPVLLDGALVFIYEDNIVFETGNLFAVDANGVETDKVFLELIQSVDDDNSNNWLIKTYVDDEYLNDPSRKWPIIIDPSIMISETNTLDSFVGSKSPGTNYNSGSNLQYLRTGRDDPYYIRRTFIKFNIPSSVRNVTSANLRLKKSSGVNPTAYAYRVTSSWSSSTVTWNNQPSYTSSGSSSMSTHAGSDWFQMGVTSIVNAWATGTTNYGFLVKDQTESGTSHWTTFYSSDAPSPNKPELIIYYTGYSYTMTHYYDNGYNVRISSASSAINGHQTVVSGILQDVFGLNVSSTRQIYTSCADDCKILTYGSVTSSNLTGSCSHSTQHLTTAALRTELIADKGNGTTTHTRFLWTGHFMPGNPASNSNSTNHTVIITPMAICDSSGNTLTVAATVTWQSRYSLLHEASHQLGAPDHYCYNPSGTCTNTNCWRCYKGLSSAPVCVMTSRKNIENITPASNLYCSGCKTTINSHLSSHH